MWDFYVRELFFFFLLVGCKHSAIKITIIIIWLRNKFKGKEVFIFSFYIIVIFFLFLLSPIRLFLSASLIPFGFALLDSFRSNDSLLLCDDVRIFLPSFFTFSSFFLCSRGRKKKRIHSGNIIIIIIARHRFWEENGKIMMLMGESESIKLITAIMNDWWCIV